MNDIENLQIRINCTFVDAFGRTPLKQRLEDILNEALELSRATDIKNLREELGDLLSSAMMLANECDWKVLDLVSENLDKIQRRSRQYCSLGRKIKVALLGGAFDPPTQGHIEVAQFVLNTSKTFDEVWLVPCFRHMDGKEMTSAEHRLKMCEIAVEQDKRIKVFPYEIDHELKGETYHFLKMLLEEDIAKHECTFSYIIGQDNANTFDTWVNYEHLEKMIGFVVIPRQGVEPEGNWYLKPPHIYLTGENPPMDVSSTKVRNDIFMSRDPVPWDGSHARYRLERSLAPGILEYTGQHGLYTDDS